MAEGVGSGNGVLDGTERSFRMKMDGIGSGGGGGGALGLVPRLVSSNNMADGVLL